MGSPPSGVMNWAKAKFSPNCAASRALWSLEPRSHKSGSVDVFGLTSIAEKASVGGGASVRNAIMSATRAGKYSTPIAEP